MNTADLSPVDFHGQTLFLVEHNEQPFTPMKPIVEGMGLDWAGQYTKFNSYRDRWGIEMISIPSLGGDQDTVCMPLRKLPAWLLGINPSKVRPAIRKKVIMYQRECDDALWDYWTKGQAVNPRAALPTPEPQVVGILPIAPDVKLTQVYDDAVRSTVAQREPLRALVLELASALYQMGFKIRVGGIYRIITTRFGIESVKFLAKKDLPIVEKFLQDMLVSLRGFPSVQTPALPKPIPDSLAAVPTLPAPEIPQTDGLSPSEHAHMVIQAQLDSLDKVFYLVDDYLYEARRTINAEADKLADGVPCRDKPARRALASELKTSFGTHTHAVLSDINAVRSVLRLTATAAGMILPKKGRGYPRKLALTA